MFCYFEFKCQVFIQFVSTVTLLKTLLLPKYLTPFFILKTENLKFLELSIFFLGLKTEILKHNWSIADVMIIGYFYNGVIGESLSNVRGLL